MTVMIVQNLYLTFCTLLALHCHHQRTQHEVYTTHTFCTPTQLALSKDATCTDVRHAGCRVEGREAIVEGPEAKSGDWGRAEGRGNQTAGDVHVVTLRAGTAVGDDDGANRSDAALDLSADRRTTAGTCKSYLGSAVIRTT